MRLFVHTTSLLFLSWVFFSCSGKNRDAKAYLAEAGQAYKESNYTLAKLKIDSIKILFPKSFDEITAGFALMQQIRMSENRRNIIYCDSMLREQYNHLSEMLSKFDYVRDDRYQEFGEYYPKIYPHRSSLDRNGLRSGVGEKGVLFIESILSGTAIQHHKIKIVSGEGSFAESLVVSSDGLNYRFRTLDKSYEIVRFTGNNENGVARFIYTFQNDPLRVEFIGKRTITVPLGDAAKQGIVHSFELSTLLLNIEQLKFEKEKSETLIRYLQSKEKTEDGTGNPM
ncbi:MAG: hypothetical protein A2W86_00215 [Bacteroidetes bacterium GWD2_45_23]|nr:MAG: hypothetical protein A2W87_04735 [Bacteroidetes bacterium GWC2_46_850]OFX86461.1 MAG: hypothetical protein A2W86_00215 [Bacteroidetes bacterium GWD2_45_23]HBB00020.1 hypothetical protein [Porphyromonadaceae bacterium]HCC16953.1 hypothetical protein [Porphyromonadaceae bacterium]